MCAQVSADDFIRAHHEIGHIHYFMSYKNQPIPFRDGANPAFLDSVASLSALSARTNKYLNDVGLGRFEDSTGTVIKHFRAVHEISMTTLRNKLSRNLQNFMTVRYKF